MISDWNRNFFSTILFLTSTDFYWRIIQLHLSQNVKNNHQKKHWDTSHLNNDKALQQKPQACRLATKSHEYHNSPVC